MDLFGIEFGTWAEWAGAVAGGVGTVLSIFALRFAKQANSLARETNDAALRRAQERDARERALELRTAAANLQAWWVIKKPVPGGKEEWGIMITNSSPGSAVFRNVSVEAQADGANFAGLTKPFECLPPGQYFIPDKKNCFPQAIDPKCKYEPVTRSPRYVVEKLQYTDPLGQQWIWTSNAGLEKVALQDLR